MRRPPHAVPQPKNFKQNWRGVGGSNPWPTDRQSVVLTNWTNPAETLKMRLCHCQFTLGYSDIYLQIAQTQNLVARAGFEPAVFSLWDWRDARLLHPAILFPNLLQNHEPVSDIETFFTSQPNPTSSCGYYERIIGECIPLFSKKLDSFLLITWLLITVSMYGWRPRNRT